MLGGRAIQRFLYPFIYREVKSDFDLDDVLKFGTLPSVFQQDPIEKIETLKAYSQIYLKEEIQAEGIVRNLGGFSRFLDIASAQFAELLNYSNIARDSKVSSRVISSYYEILEDTLIGFKLLPYSKSIRKRLVNQPKFYFFDNGVTNSINQTITLQNNPLYEGKLFEQFIIQEFYRYLNYSNSEAKLFFWRTNHGAEIDLVIEKHGKLVAGIEIKYSDIITGAHLSGLRSFRQDHPNIPLFIISRVQHPYELDDVQVIPWHSYEEILELI
jgi:predicted AAA+ superfamily ATPase